MGYFAFLGSGIAPVVSEVPTGMLRTGTDYRLGQVSSLDIWTPNPATDNFEVAIAFTSGESATSVSYPDGIKWSGTDVSDGVFIPVKNTRYNAAFWFDGAYVNAVVRGVSI